MITRAVPAKPLDDRVVVADPGLAALLDLRQQEHLVVHREAEEDREHQQRHEGDDRDLAVEPDQLEADALLEDQDQHPVGGGDREQVHQPGGERHDDRAERDHQQQEAERDDDRDHERQLLADLVGEVDVGGGRAADEGGRRPVALSASGMTSSRSRLTSSTVRCETGEDCEVTLIDGRVPVAC